MINAARNQIGGIYGILTGIGSVGGHAVQADARFVRRFEQILQGVRRFFAHQLLIIIIREGKAYIRNDKIVRHIILA